MAIVSAFALTRLYGPEAFAHLEMFALVTRYWSIDKTVLGTGKFEQALMLPKSESAAQSLLWAGQRAVLWTVLIVAVIVWPTAGWVTEQWSLEGWWSLAVILPVFVGVAAHSRLMEYWHHRHGKAGPVALANGGAPLLAESGKFAAFGSLPFSLRLGVGCGRGVVGALGASNMLRRGVIAALKSASPRRSEPLAGTAKAYIDYPTWVLAGSAMNRLAQWLHVLLLGVALGPVLLGMLGLARRMVMQPLSILAASAAPVLFKSATDLEDGAPLRRLFWKACLAVFSLIALGVWLTVFLAPDRTTAWLFGEAWLGAMAVVRLLVPWFALNFVASGLGSMFHRVQKPRWITALDALHLLVVSIGWWLGTQYPSWFGGSEWGALVGIVQAKCAYYVVNIAVLIFAVMTHRHADR